MSGCGISDDYGKALGQQSKKRKPDFLTTDGHGWTRIKTLFECQHFETAKYLSEKKSKWSRLTSAATSNIESRLEINRGTGRGRLFRVSFWGWIRA
jgi:hypothetical protein